MNCLSEFLLFLKNIYQNKFNISIKSKYTLLSIFSSPRHHILQLTQKQPRNIIGFPTQRPKIQVPPHTQRHVFHGSLNQCFSFLCAGAFLKGGMASSWTLFEVHRIKAFHFCGQVHILMAYVLEIEAQASVGKSVVQSYDLFVLTIPNWSSGAEERRNDPLHIQLKIPTRPPMSRTSTQMARAFQWVEFWRKAQEKGGATLWLKRLVVVVRSCLLGWDSKQWPTKWSDGKW